MFQSINNANLKDTDHGNGDDNDDGNKTEYNLHLINLSNNGRTK